LESPDTPDAIDDLIALLGRLSGEYGPSTVGIDALGRIARLPTAMLLDPEHGVDLHAVHEPGVLVNRSRRTTRGGDRKSDPADAKVIAHQIRMRAGSNELCPVALRADRTRCCGCSPAAAGRSPTRLAD
jgi:hypothetical protein